MRLNAPTIPVFLLSVAMVAAVIAIKYFGTHIPYAGTVVQKVGLFEILLFAYGILFLGNVLRRF